MQKFAGMLFTLKKRMQSISKDDSGLYKYMVLGYYDGLDIHTVDRWYDLRPKGLLERKLQVDLKDPFIDQYTIRALIPSDREKLDKQGFAYSFWEEAGRKEKKDYKEYEERIRTEHPFVSMSVINLTEEFVKSLNSLQMIQETLIEVLCKSVKQANYDLKKLHCAVFPSIGYSDFIILFHTDDLTKPANIISQMRGAVVSDNVKIMSNCYSVCALDKTYFENQNKNSSLGQNLYVSIRINLNEGVSSRDFLDRLCEEVKEESGSYGYQENEINLFVEAVKKHYYITFGNSDCLLLPEQPLERYLKWHGPDQILNPGSPFFRRYISNVRTSVRVDGDKCIQTGNEFAPFDKDLSTYEWKLDKFIKNYDEFLEKHNMHIRNSRAMRQIMKNFLNIVQASHGFDAKHVLGTVFDALIQDVDYYIARQPKTIEKGMQADEIEEVNYYNTRIKEEKYGIVEVIENFKEFIGLFISDLIRSDRPFIEGNALTHSSIGSATKLLFAYSSMLEKLTIKNKRNKYFIFVVLSGGCDRTEAIDLFAFEHHNEKVKKPVIIRIPEMSLYDIQGTLFRILHEYMHFIGDRKRKERFYYLLNAVSNYIAWEMGELEFGVRRLEELCSRAVIHLSNKLKKNVEKEIVSNYLRMKDETKKKIAEAIRTQKLFTDYEKMDREDYFYASSLERGVLNLCSVAKIFCTNERKFEEEPEDNLQKKIYSILYESDKKLIESIIGIFENMTSRTKKEYEKKLLRMPLQTFRFLQQNYIFRDAHPEAYDIKIKKFIEQYFGSLLQNFPLENGGKENFRAVFPYTKILADILYSMVECFSDCKAILTIDMKAEDFLLSFIYELWEIEKAFPLSSQNILRLGADLKVIYGIEHRLPDKVINSLKKKVYLRDSQGYTYKNVDQMLVRINSILEKYQFTEFDGIRNELEKYLQVCIGKKEYWHDEELIGLYKICEMKTSKEIYAVVNEIICHWKNLGKGAEQNENIRNFISQYE